MQDIAAIRKHYSQKTLSENDVAADPIQQFGRWWEEAVSAEIEEVNAMTLATASLDAVPSARIVLLKGFSTEGFIFFTNYNSYKGRQLAENPKACLVFFWKELERQVRIIGLVGKLGADENDKYFHSRPLDSQVGAAASPQSEVIQSRHWLEEQFRRVEQEVRENQVQRPLHWGGYRVRPVIIEFWQGRLSRLHDRIQYTLEDSGRWKIERLAP
ncbi:MAG TPA: pyridoxamine 5'-phosphate oxidase [Chitinophagaceae bacterium]|nr:pyridoxamine 5'-phosphate oxidase [Chitinophagaceae bacterium]